MVCNRSCDYQVDPLVLYFSETREKNFNAVRIIGNFQSPEERRRPGLTCADACNFHNGVKRKMHYMSSN